MTAVGTVWWIELRTTNEQVARDFYTRLMGWQTFQPGLSEPSEGAGAYTVWMSGWKQVGGMMSGALNGGGALSGWVPFIAVKDVDDCAKRAAEMGAEILEEPFDIESSGRFALLRDPLGAIFGIAKPVSTE
jgi:predicted enzyme related to lactoylglutathione lyase